MSNSLGNWDEQIYASAALVMLEKELGIAGRIYRGYDKNPQQPGSIINLRRPTYFSAQAMPISSANTTDLVPDSVAVTLNQWYGQQVRLTDKELSYSQEQILRDHVRPLIIAVADAIDQSVNGLATQVPWYYVVQNTGTATGVGDLANLGRRLFDNKVPAEDRHLEVNGERQAWFQSQDIFARADASGTAETQQRGALGTKFGFEIFANQNVPAQPAGGSASVAGGTLTLNAALTVGATSLVLAASTVSGTFKVGDIIQVGHTGTDGLSGAALTGARNFVVTANATFGSNTVTVSVSPTVRASETAASGTVCAFKVGSTASYDCLAFHRNAFALAMAPLDIAPDGLGVRMATQADPITGLAIRTRMWYVGVEAATYFGVDALWGVVTLDRDLACRYVA